MVVAWFVAGVALVLFELHHLAFYALFGALGAFAAGVLALVAPHAVGLQAAVAVGVAVVGVGAVRPFVSRAFEHRHEWSGARGVHGGLIGEEAVTLDTVGGAHPAGHVRLAGERWLAVSGGEVSIPAMTKVVVTAVKGTTLVVWPVEGTTNAAGMAEGRQE